MVRRGVLGHVATVEGDRSNERMPRGCNTDKNMPEQ